MAVQLARRSLILLGFSACLSAAEAVSLSSGNVTLYGVRYKPSGQGPFRAVPYNRGSAVDNSAVSYSLGPILASHGWIFFMPYRRGQGRSASAGAHIRDEIPAAGRSGGISSAAKTMARLLETDHLNDQLAALDWLKKRNDVRPNQIAVMGNSFGGIETVLGAERRSYCAAVDLSGGAESWGQAPELRTLRIRAVRNARVPVFFVQPEDDFDLSPTRELSAAAKSAGPPFQAKVLPAFGSPAEEGHSFAYSAASIWIGDALSFLDERCGRLEPIGRHGTQLLLDPHDHLIACKPAPRLVRMERVGPDAPGSTEPEDPDRIVRAGRNQDVG